MHPDAEMLISNFRQKYAGRIDGLKVLDVGSQDLNGSNRKFFAGCDFVGLDIRKANGVDIVCEKEDVFPIEDNAFDVIVSGQTLEHCRRPWNTVKEMARVLKPGGIVFISAPWRFEVHKDSSCPTDCWRILEDGMRVLLEDAGLRVLEVFSYADDCVGIAEKANYGD